MLKTRRNKRTNRRGVYCPRCLPEGVRSISLPILVLALVLFIIIDVIALFIVISIIVSFPTSFPTGNGKRATMGQSRGNELFNAILDRFRWFMALQKIFSRLGNTFVVFIPARNLGNAQYGVQIVRIGRDSSQPQMGVIAPSKACSRCRLAIQAA